MSTGSAIAALVSREAVLARGETLIVQQDIALAETPQHCGLEVAFDKIRRRFKNVDLSSALRPKCRGDQDWWATLRPPHENMVQTYLDFHDGERTWRFEQVEFSASFLIGRITSVLGEKRSETGMLFDIREPESIRLVCIGGVCQFGSVQRLEGGLFAIHDGKQAGLYDDALRPVTIEGVASFDHILCQQGLCFVSLPQAQIEASMALRRHRKNATEEWKHLYAVNPVSRTFLRLPEPLAGSQVQYVLDMKHRDGVIKLSMEGVGEEYSWVLAYDMRRVSFLTFDGRPDVREAYEPTAYQSDAAYLVVKHRRSDEERLYRQSPDIPSAYQDSGQQYRTFQHCNTDFYPVRALHTGAEWQLTRQIEGNGDRFVTVVAPDGKRFSQFEEVLDLPSQSGNGDNWLGALKTPEGWVCVGNDVMLNIDGRYLFDSIEVSHDHSNKVFACVAGQDRRYVTWYYRFEVLKQN